MPQNWQHDSFSQSVRENVVECLLSTFDFAQLAHLRAALFTPWVLVGWRQWNLRMNTLLTIQLTP